MQYRLSNYIHNLTGFIIVIKSHEDNKDLDIDSMIEVTIGKLREYAYMKILKLNSAKKIC